ncbi:MAG: threonine-phosphate decarboxylase, partial [Lachnospirales bacterium]
NQETINYINSSKDLWSVNVFAEIAGETMFLDKDFIDKSISLTEEERMRFIMELGTFPYIKLYDSQSNFFLAKILRDDINSDFIFLKLIKEGILIRNCKDFPYLSDKFIRFCILSKNNNIKLIDNLKNILSKGVI